MINTDGRPTIACGVTRREQFRPASQRCPFRADLCDCADHRLRPVTVAVDRIIAYEAGELSSDEALQLIADLVRSGQAWHLQGSYGRFAAQLILAGRITEHGEIVEVDD